MVNQERKTEIANGLEITISRINAAAKSANRNPSDISLIVVTKTFPRSDADFLYELGVRDFGENRDQEGAVKAENFHPDAKWHFQGKIQSNKIKSIANWADVIHSLAEIDHAKAISDRHQMKEAALSAKYPVLIQVSLDTEKRIERNGIEPKALTEFADAIAKISGLEIKGLMAVAPIAENPNIAFVRMAEIFSDFQQKFPMATWLSAGMSGDFESAITHGATHLRIGSSILGNRSYL